MTMSQIETAPAQPRSNPGETLRLAREQKGWLLAEVATQLKLTPLALGQLEAGEFERLPGHTFARGYVRAYAKLLGLDQAALVEQFDRYTGTDARGSEVHSLGHVPEPLRLSRTVLRLASAVLLLLLLLLGYFWWQERPERLTELGALGLKHIEVESVDGTTEIHPLDEPEDQAVAEALQGEPAPMPAEAEALSPVSGEPAEPAPAASDSAAVSQPLVTVPQAVAPTPPAVIASAPAGAAAPAVQPAAEPSAAATSAEPAAAPPQVAPGEGQVQLSFGADCWTQVTDADGRVLVSTVKRAGESLQVAGKAPLELRLGNARGASEVRYNGEPVEHLKNMTASGTARLNLGQ